jgi:AcrR family transcriptional regulator
MGRGKPPIAAEGGMDNTRGEKSRPRARILSVAAELFHRPGIRSVGVEAIAEAADTSKMTLYRHFASKDELIARYLRHFTELAHFEKPEPVDPAEALLLLRTWLSEMADHLDDPDGRGCRFANAAVELLDISHPARRVIKTYKIAHRRWLIRLCRAAGLSKPAMLADALYLLLEGARVTTQSFGRAGIGARFRRLGGVTIAAHMSK